MEVFRQISVQSGQHYLALEESIVSKDDFQKATLSPPHPHPHPHLEPSSYCYWCGMLIGDPQILAFYTRQDL